MILITGATGNYGGLTIKHLLNKGVAANQIVALVRDEAKAQDLKDKGVELRIGDYDNVESLKTAFQGIDQLLFISASDVEKRLPQHENVMEAAKAAGVGHIVYTSFERQNNTSSSPIAFVAEAHLRTEELLKESGISHTILRNNLYMDFVPVFIGEQVLDQKNIYLPAENGKAGFVLREDMAEATAQILVNEPQETQVLEFSNEENYSYQDVADAISKVTGTQINYTSPSVEEYTSTLLGLNVPEGYVHMFAGFAKAQADGELAVSSTTINDLLGRKATTLEEFVNTVYGK
ncbi:NAD(P)H dehydrogenase (quinone) [Lishizhenia tianjinensis]|uniref:NAD(P)H dehydrogenase (Quinone) n=1 Tax=Lishizhenia tianjinensis TaxID=477690 RepID=A0A1I6XPK7_9FLAO|nr:SDR family oxidoreductase [Lishizhenia tianjinensis]SFT40268.1 NAD(P)H dehydrogenase (quinone) [Lishizhenia tianjinensis]